MTDNTVLNADATFFKALLAADRAALDAVLAPDFVLVGVADGQIVPRAALLDLVGSRDLEFLDIVWDRGDTVLRSRPGMAVVVGHTQMRMRFQTRQLQCTAATSTSTSTGVASGGSLRRKVPQLRTAPVPSESRGSLEI
jgi:hypothetical protein